MGNEIAQTDRGHPCRLALAGVQLLGGWKDHEWCMSSKGMHVARCSTLWGQLAALPGGQHEHGRLCQHVHGRSLPRYWSLVPDVLHRICEAPRRQRMNAVYLIRVEALGRPDEASLSESQASTESNAAASLKNNPRPCDIVVAAQCSGTYLAPWYLYLHRDLNIIMSHFRDCLYRLHLSLCSNLTLGRGG